MDYVEINSRSEMPSLKISLTVLITELLSEMPLLLPVAIITYGVLQMGQFKKLFYSFKLKNQCGKLHLASGVYCAYWENCYSVSGQQYSMLTEIFG